MLNLVGQLQQSYQSSQQKIKMSIDRPSFDEKSAGLQTGGRGSPGDGTTRRGNYRGGTEQQLSDAWASRETEIKKEVEEREFEVD